MGVLDFPFDLAAAQRLAYQLLLDQPEATDADLFAVAHTVADSDGAGRPGSFDSLMRRALALERTAMKLGIQSRGHGTEAKS